MAENNALEHDAELQRIIENAAGHTRDYTIKAAALNALSNAFRQQMAITIQGSLNAQLAKIPQETYEEKKELAKWLNAEMRKFGIAVCCPKTGRASLLYADHGRHPAQGRFQLDNSDDEGNKHRTLSFNELISLTFMADDLSRAAWGKWAGPNKIPANRTR